MQLSLFASRLSGCSSFRQQSQSRILEIPSTSTSFKQSRSIVKQSFDDGKMTRHGLSAACRMPTRRCVSVQASSHSNDPFPFNESQYHRYSSLPAAKAATAALTAGILILHCHAESNSLGSHTVRSRSTRTRRTMFSSLVSILK